jgi:DNA segregation ATPase FtsK/SpoIIIE, S-DNA-T family
MAWFTPSPTRRDRPEGLSIFDPIHLGTDPLGRPVTLQLAYRNLLCGGLPGSGKSAGMANVLGHAALCTDVDLILLDGKELDLMIWEPLAVEVVGADVAAAMELLTRLQAEMAETYRLLRAAGLDKMPRAWRRRMRLIVVDELAMYLSVYGTKDEQKQFATLLRDLVARGRAAGLMVLAATQRPSADLIPTSLRDLFAYRWALRCANKDSSDIILGPGWAKEGYDAALLDPTVEGIGYLLAEGGLPIKFRAAYLTRSDIAHLVAAGLALRGTNGQAAA